MHTQRFGAVLAQPGWDLSAQARLAWEYGSVFPCDRDNCRPREIDARYRPFTIGDFTSFGDVGVGLQAVDGYEHYGEYPDDSYNGWLVYGDRADPLICGKDAFGDNGYYGAPRFWPSECERAIVKSWWQGSGSPMPSTSILPSVPFDAFGDLSEPDARAGDFAAIVCHATLQWFPDHESLVPSLMSMLESDGVFAACVPQFGRGMEFCRPQGWYECMCPGEYDIHVNFGEPREFNILTIGEYDGILAGCSREHRICEVAYHVTLRDASSLEEWCDRPDVRKVLDGWESLFPKQRRDGAKGRADKELMKWLEAGAPEMAEDGIRLRYPFIMMTAIR